VKGADHYNFEALVLEGNELWHWFRDNQVDGLPWIRVGQVPVKATGPASMIQSDYHSDEDHGNFEALIPTADGLWHWFRNNATGEWKPVVQVTPRPGSVGCIITSDYENEEDHRAFEALVFEPHESGVTGVVWHFFWKPTEGRWEKTRALTDKALGPACLIQSDYIKGRDHHNLEALVWMREGGQSVLKHFWRKDDIGSLSWVDGVIVSDRAQGPASMIQGDFHSDEDHGNFEAIFVEFDNDVWHSFRDQSTMIWSNGGTVT
jgi:hypothetical protein